jgi:hypothetical protein
MKKAKNILFNHATDMFFKRKQNFGSSTVKHFNVLESSFDKNLTKIEEREEVYF